MECELEYHGGFDRIALYNYILSNFSLNHFGADLLHSLLYVVECRNHTNADAAFYDLRSMLPTDVEDEEIAAFVDPDMLTESVLSVLDTKKLADVRKDD